MSTATKLMKTFLRQGLGRFGLEIRRADRPWRPPDCPDSIGTVIDVGAADGTPGLYAAYPEAQLIALDPLQEQLDRLTAHWPDREIVPITTALGSQERELELTIPADNLFKSSLNARTDLTEEGGQTETRMVSVRRLDDIVAEHPQWARPLVLKIDTEGHDLDVLKGATATLEECPVVYTEVSLGRRFESGYSFSDLTTFLFDAGFELVDVLDAPLGRDRHVAFLDCVWARV